MSYEPNPYVEPERPPGRTRRFGRLPRAALTGGVVVGLALGGAGLAFAASGGGSGTPSPAGATVAGTSSTTVPGSAKPAGHPRVRRPFGPGGVGLGRFGAIAGLGGLGNVVHWQAKVRSGNGYKTVEFQAGQVTGVTSTSITVLSTDGYTHTYTVVPTTAVNAQVGGISSVVRKDQVEITSSTVSGTDTASNIVDITKLRSSRTSFGFGPGSKVPPSPSGGSTASAPFMPSPPQ